MQTLPTTYRWTRGDYERAVAAGVFEGTHVELIGGQIVQMSPKGPRHAWLTMRVRKLLERSFPAGTAHGREEKSLDLGEWDVPEPDVAVVVGDEDRYAVRHPTAAEALVVEIAISTRDYDLGDRAYRYAAARIRDYWVICPAEDEVIVCREPSPGSGVSKTGWDYAHRQSLRRGDVIVPVAAAGVALPAAELLPPSWE